MLPVITVFFFCLFYWMTPSLPNACLLLRFCPNRTSNLLTYASQCSPEIKTLLAYKTRKYDKEFPWQCCSLLIKTWYHPKLKFKSKSTVHHRNKYSKKTNQQTNVRCPYENCRYTSEFSKQTSKTIIIITMYLWVSKRMSPLADVQEKKGYTTLQNL